MVGNNHNDYIPLATSPSGAGEEGVDEQKERILRRSHNKLFFPLNHLPNSIRSRHRLLFLLLPIPLIVILLSLGRHFFGTTSSPSSSGGLDLQIGENPYFYTGDVWKHNDLVIARLSHCRELGILRNTSLPFTENEKLSQEEDELILQGCGTNQTTVLILSSLWFAEAFAGTSTAGETIYAQSVISTLNAYNYSYVFTSLGWYNADMRKTVELWSILKDNVRMVLADPDQVNVCYTHSDQKCLKTKENIEGIPAWKIMSFWYWDDPANPLGTQFTLSPSPRNDNYFLSYSIEPTCRRLPSLPTSHRHDPPQAYLLAKQIHYLENSTAFSWTLETLVGLQDTYGITVVGGMTDDDEVTSKRVKELGIKNMGKLPKLDFYQELSKSFVFVGVGRPRISPSPWDALCMGVPFINPILTWDEEDPQNRTKWHAQQWHMTDLEPPYVYSVHAHDLSGLSEAVGLALQNPIESYIPDYMRFDFACHRTADLVESDWRSKAESILQERTESGEGQVSCVFLELQDGWKGYEYVSLIRVL
ncbi:hypothetical protein I204_02065 [Kwoniella mangroviensis CBS 8886]|uniref:uncharacterized protein n=1 Tax=Kwoniella mangroviensis CBS 8507 TaxID=1296122 RepID=UPI00080D457C|nr:uncharacterized protein I203_03628 [Kwoniella mangroviensis CBS 8507]OCF66946.1 hypothetical protein I203_03628 [Kwoniella mangroviensis CBS 8507]OCF78059.1 hypothetical protein I204_02065 [Kwoniella mangroviensis CBS 8886]